MKRRDFLSKSALLASVPLTLPLVLSAKQSTEPPLKKKANNIIFMVSDGMSIGTLTMVNLLKERKEGKSTKWIQLYQDQKVVRSLMETSSADSIVTDSAAASSAWGGGIKVNNNSLNINPKGDHPVPILQQFKKSGKSVGCVTTVPITHATPAGFCVNTESRKNQELIAKLYLELDFDVMMGGGKQYFTSYNRADGEDVGLQFVEKGYHVAENKISLSEFATQNAKEKILGLFASDALPYYIDRLHDKKYENCPSLLEMSKVAIQHLNKNNKGFALQIEAGKVDWAAHGNDIGGLLYDQLEFDKTLEWVMNFAEQDGNTLVIITTDHGNANPGILYGKEADKKFDLLQHYKASNAEILSSLTSQSAPSQLVEKIKTLQGWNMKTELAEQIIAKYNGITADDLSNYRNLPFFDLAEQQEKEHSIGWIGHEHSADLVELCAFGPGSELFKTFHRNTEIHEIMRKAVGII